jgi:AraC-like DNA-binding protein
MVVSTTPRGRLGELIDSIWLHDVPVTRSGRERRLPTGRVELVVNLHEDRFSLGYGPGRQEEYPGAVVAGPFARPYALDVAQQNRVLGVVFKPGAARPLLGVPLHELAGRHVALADVWGHEAVELRERVLEATGPRERLSEVERVLRRRLTGAVVATHPLAVEAIARIARAPVRYGVAQLSDRLGWTPRRLQQVFRAEVGLTPRAFQRLARFRSTLEGIDGAAEVGWARFALEHGYCDQSHLIREFGEHAGLSPSAYLRLRGPALNHVPG